MISMKSRMFVMSALTGVDSSADDFYSPLTVSIADTPVQVLAPDGPSFWKDDWPRFSPELYRAFDRFVDPARSAVDIGAWSRRAAG